MHGDDDDDFDNTVKGIKEHIQQYEGHSDVKLQTCIGMSQARPFFFFFTFTVKVLGNPPKVKRLRTSI